MCGRMVEANGVELCTEPFGDPTDPPILLSGSPICMRMNS
jgi:hypothetical protein